MTPELKRGIVGGVLMGLLAYGMTGCGWLMTKKKHEADLQAVADQLYNASWRGCDNLRVVVNQLLLDMEARKK